MSRTEAVQRKKERLRREFLDRRDRLDQASARRASEKACRRLAQISVFADVQRVAGYAARGAELAVRSFLQHLHQRGVQILLPRVIGPGQMEFCPVDSWDELVDGSFGIKEPTSEAVSTQSIEVFLVPGVAFDRRGGRIGFGMGYYDRALPPLNRALALGVCHHWQVVDEPLPLEEHDRPMDWLVSDEVSLKFDAHSEEGR